MPISGDWASYDTLPEAIKQYLTREQYAWLPDGEKHRLLDGMTEPDYEEDDSWR